MKPPRILSRKEVFRNRWVTLVEKSVDFGLGGSPADYYCMVPREYVSVVALTPDGRIPLVHQFRPAVEAMTCELPAGLVEDGETPESCCRRELEEEVGLRAVDVKYLGSHYPDTGRLQNRLHTFFAKTSGPLADFKAEPGLSVELVTPAELRDRIGSGRFPHLLHLASILLVDLSVGLFQR